MSDGQSIQFPTTQWSGVALAGQQDTAGRVALGELLVRYMTPMRAHLVLQKRLPADQAEDLLQAFVTDRVLEKDLVGSAAQEKGRFRTFLLVALDRFVINAVRDAKRHCRAPGAPFQSSDIQYAEDPGPSPGDAFDIAWAREVLIQAAERMRVSCRRSGRLDVWQLFEARVLSPTMEGAEPTPYEQLLVRFSLPSVEAASNLVVTGKRMFARSLRGVVGEYTGVDGQVDQEIDELRAYPVIGTLKHVAADAHRSCGPHEGPGPLLWGALTRSNHAIGNGGLQPPAPGGADGD